MQSQGLSFQGPCLVMLFSTMACGFCSFHSAGRWEVCPAMSSIWVSCPESTPGLKELPEPLRLVCASPLDMLLWCPQLPLVISPLKVSHGAPGWLSWLSVQLLISAHVMILQFVGSSPTLGSALMAWNLLGILFPSLCRSPTCAFSLSK